MKLQLTRSFDKDIRKCKDKTLFKRVKAVLDSIKQSDSLNDVANVKALKANGNFYRIRIR